MQTSSVWNPLILEDLDWNNSTQDCTVSDQHMARHFIINGNKLGATEYTALSQTFAVPPDAEHLAEVTVLFKKAPLHNSG